MRTFTFYLIRHSRAVNEPLVVGSTDIPLTSDGEQIAADCGKLTANWPIDAVFTSPLKRASQTARLLFPQASPIVLDDLREYCFGELEMRRFADLMPEVDLAKLTQLTSSAKGAEKKKDYLDRLFSAFFKIIESCMKSSVYSVAIVTHGYNIMTLMAAFSYPKLSTMFDYKVGNCCGYVLKTDTAMWMRDRALEIAGEINKGEIVEFER